MNRHSNNNNALLVEIMIAVLFFALCSTVLLQVFTGVHRQSELSGVRTDALRTVRSLTEELNAADDPQAVLSENGVTLMADGTWQLEHTGPAYTVRIVTDSQPQDSGTLFTAQLTAEVTEDEPLFTLHSAHYVPREVE